MIKLALIMKISVRQFGLYCGLLSFGGGLGFLINSYLNQGGVVAQNQVINTPLMRSPSVVVENLEGEGRVNFIAKAVQLVGPSVVKIDASRQVSSNFLEFNNPFFDRFFEDEVKPDHRMEAGTGSGFIISEDGQVLTNAHVVEGADTVTVTLKDGQTFTGKVMGIDTMTDIAVIKIEANNLPSAPLGVSNDLIPGEWAIAIGNPMGLDNTVTVGIISALDRTSSQVGVPNKRVKFIQTDAAINPGNSGGPLLNGKGQVIGINTAIRPNAQGLGFAIPIETAQYIAQQLLTKGTVDHPYLGIHMVTLTPNWQNDLELTPELKALNIKAKEGILVVKVVENSPAAQAEFKIGDIITKVGDQPVTSATDVQQQVESSKIGEILEVQVIRNQKNVTLKVRPSAFPSN
jgi:S1-C subfamily serine protease